VHEYPISYYPRNYIQGKKISWKDGVAALWFIVKFNWQSFDRQRYGNIPEHYIPSGRQWL